MRYGLSEAEVEWMQDGYRMFREGDPALMDRYAPDAVFRFPATLPAGGTYTGPLEAMEFWTTVGELFDTPEPHAEEFLRIEDRHLVLGTWRARSRETGEEIAVRFLHAYRTSDGGTALTEQKIVSFELFIDTAEILRVLGPAAG